MNITNYPLVSVYTCVYNGEKTIHRVFKTMKSLTYPNIEHVIINDGSTDNTEALIEEYRKEVSFPIKYHKKENGGKHTAMNVAWDISEGEFMIQLDADDELYPDAIDRLVAEYYSIPEEKRENYWVVNGRCVTQNGDFVGVPYPEGINSLSREEAIAASAKCPGEKASLQVRRHLAPYRFPEVVGARFLPETIIWKQLNQKYQTRYCNEVVRVYYVNEGGNNLTAKSKSRRQYNAFTYNFKWMVMHPELYTPSFSNVLKYSVGYFISDKVYRDNNKYLDGITSAKNRLLLSVVAPFSFVGAALIRIAKGIK